MTDRVLPRVPIRQWVLTLPFRLRFMLAHDPELTSLVLGLFLSELFRWMRKRVGPRRGQAGAVTLIQRFGGALNLNPHFHTLVPDGVYHRPAPDGPLEFLPLPPPTASEIDALTTRIADRIFTNLRGRGLLVDEAVECPVDDEATLALCVGASVQGVIAFGDQPGAHVERAGQAEGGPAHSRHEVHGFSLHASEPVPAEDRERLERLIRYTARPPVPDERVSLRRDGAWSARSAGSRWRSSPSSPTRRSSGASSTPLAWSCAFWYHQAKWEATRPGQGRWWSLQWGGNRRVLRFLRPIGRLMLPTRDVARRFVVGSQAGGVKPRRETGVPPSAWRAMEATTMNPEFTRDAYRGLDLEWFAVDRRGAIAILTTGYGLIPKAVFESEEQHRRCCEFFEAAAETSGARLATDLDPRGDYQLFLGEARRGFYSYFHSDFRPHEPYQLIAYPLTPLLLEELPEELQAALLRFRLGRVEFSRTDTLRMHEHFECE